MKTIPTVAEIEAKVSVETMQKIQEEGRRILDLGWGWGGENTPPVDREIFLALIGYFINMLASNSDLNIQIFDSITPLVSIHGIEVDWSHSKFGVLLRLEFKEDNYLYYFQGSDLANENNSVNAIGYNFEFENSKKLFEFMNSFIES